MKTKNLTIGLMFLAGVLGFTSCQDEKIDPQEETAILPQQFSVDIPDAISYEATQLKSSNGDTLNGKSIYEPLGYFIKIGEGASEIVEALIFHIGYYHINGPMDITFDGDDDGRQKHLVVKENVSFANQTWEFELTITDLEFEGNEDGGQAMQIFWNTSPVEGIALLKPANLNINDTSEVKNAVYRIDYSEANSNGYTHEMTVYIADMPLANPLEDPYSCNAIKLWAGKDGDFIDVRGNSNHPNARFFDKDRQQGFNWAFVASSNERTDIACAEVALPPSDLNKNGRNEIMTEYGVRNVFEREVFKLWPVLADGSATSKALLDAYLSEADAPGYFNKQGFQGGGQAPSQEYIVLTQRIEGLTPFNPNEVSNQKLEFKR